MEKIFNVFFGLAVSAGVPLGLLWLATKMANKVNKHEDSDQKS